MATPNLSPSSTSLANASPRKTSMNLFLPPLPRLAEWDFKGSEDLWALFDYPSFPPVTADGPALKRNS